VGELPWYRRFSREMLVDVGGLSLEERGAYFSLLELIHANNGAIDDDDKLIADWLHIDIRIWRKRLRPRLVDQLGKLYKNGPNLRNAGMDKEISEGQKRYRDAVAAGKRSAESRGDVIRLLKDVQPKTGGRGGR
jgi:uncharacterized protein YdaU (DUF1376 family)